MRNKRKGILMASAILGSAAIVSTGFAAWVITIEDSETLNGNIEVDTVSDKSIIIEQSTETAHVSSRDALVRFTADANNGEAHDWLKGTGEDDLSATFFVKVTLGANRISEFDDAEKGGLTATLSSAKYTAAETAGYVDAMPTVSNGKIAITQVDASGAASSSKDAIRYYKIQITFNWGSYFDGLNPTAFYNQGNYDALRSSVHTDEESCVNPTKTLLSDFQDVVASAAYTGLAGEGAFALTISAKTPASN